MNRKLLFGPCAKRRMQAVLHGASGKVYVAENVCLNPQQTCPRELGEGYEKCKTICRQVDHGEAQVIAAAGEDKRARDRKFKKALRNYRRNVRPMADEPHSLLDSWLFLLPLGLMCIGVLLWQAGVFK